ncbi:MAG: hypothetical protein HPY44_16215 [Armatimonadetes bacterium]|nr:hypothetical protein [Armatimonadota bacterium]
MAFTDHASDADDGLRAGVARVDVTDYEAGPVNDPLYVKALVLAKSGLTVAIITVDAVALGEIGHIGNDYLPAVRERLRAELCIEPRNIVVNASHCHGVVCDDVAERTVQAVAGAKQSLVPVRVGAGTGYERRITQNRRLRLKDGREADVRHAYPLPPDDEVAGIGPVDPEIGILRIDRLDGRPLAVVFNFACHPIQGVPSGGNTADISGFACRAIEAGLGQDAVALFIQGCAGDINPVLYKDVDRPRDAEPLGNLLGLSVLDALRGIETHGDGALAIVHDVLELPRADLAPAIVALEEEQERLLRSLQNTSINLKTFLQLVMCGGLAPEFPSYYSHGYLHEAATGAENLKRMDALNREQVQRYRANCLVMEQYLRVRENLKLLRMHQAQNEKAGWAPVEAELVGLRVGDFVLVTSPGELSVQIGLNIKAASPHENTFVAGCTNGYIYYAPTADQLENRGWAQEDSDCMLAPEWQALFEERAQAALELLRDC